MEHRGGKQGIACRCHGKLGRNPGLEVIHVYYPRPVDNLIFALAQALGFPGCVSNSLYHIELTESGRLSIFSLVVVKRRTMRRWWDQSVELVGGMEGCC